MTTVGIIGAGHIGTALAKGFIYHGYDVVIPNPRGPEMPPPGQILVPTPTTRAEDDVQPPI